MTFDSTFREVPTQASLLANMTLRQALDAVARATGTFYQVTGPTAIVVVPDTPAKRREYTQEVLQTFYLRNADLKETIDALRVVGDLRTIAADHRHERDRGQRHARTPSGDWTLHQRRSTRRGRRSSSTSRSSKSIGRSCSNTACSSRRQARRASTAAWTSTATGLTLEICAT